MPSRDYNKYKAYVDSLTVDDLTTYKALSKLRLQGRFDALAKKQQWTPLLRQDIKQLGDYMEQRLVQFHDVALAATLNLDELIDKAKDAVDDLYDNYSVWQPTNATEVALKAEIKHVIEDAIVRVTENAQEPEILYPGIDADRVQALSQILVELQTHIDLTDAMVQHQMAAEVENPERVAVVEEAATTIVDMDLVQEAFDVLDMLKSSAKNFKPSSMSEVQHSIQLNSYIEQISIKLSQYIHVSPSSTKKSDDLKTIIQELKQKNTELNTTPESPPTRRKQ